MTAYLEPSVKSSFHRRCPIRNNYVYRAILVSRMMTIVRNTQHRSRMMTIVRNTQHRSRMMTIVRNSIVLEFCLFCFVFVLLFLFPNYTSIEMIWA